MDNGNHGIRTFFILALIIAIGQSVHIGNIDGSYCPSDHYVTASSGALHEFTINGHVFKDLKCK